MRTSTNSPVDWGVVSEEENDSGSDEETVLIRTKRSYRSRNWLKWIPRLARTGRNGTKRPPVGRVCLVLKGDAEVDVGKMVVVVRQTKCMVAVVWKDEGSGDTREKLKHPESLIQLEDGLVLEQDTDGMLWVVREKGAVE
jgi:hypothetical protein